MNVRLGTVGIKSLLFLLYYEVLWLNKKTMTNQSNTKKETEARFPLLRMLELLFKKSKQINVAQARSMIKEKNAIIIDVRKNKDFQQSHVEGALSIEGNMFNNFIDQTNKSKPIICYCYKGISSKRFCGKLARAGFKNVYNLKGGYDAWRKEQESDPN